MIWIEFFKFDNTHGRSHPNAWNVWKKEKSFLNETVENIESMVLVLDRPNESEICIPNMHSLFHHMYYYHSNFTRAKTQTE